MFSQIINGKLNHSAMRLACKHVCECVFVCAYTFSGWFDQNTKHTVLHNTKNEFKSINLVVDTYNWEQIALINYHRKCLTSARAMNSIAMFFVGVNRNTMQHRLSNFFAKVCMQ